MNAGNVIQSLAYALVSACAKDLLPNKQKVYRYERDADHESRHTHSQRIDTGETKDVRPHEGECEVYHFLQGWGSTALGFGGFGGQAMTSAYTTAVVGPLGDVCVYFDGRLAYHLERPNDRFYKDLGAHAMVSVADSGVYRE